MMVPPLFSAVNRLPTSFKSQHKPFRKGETAALVFFPDRSILFPDPPTAPDFRPAEAVSGIITAVIFITCAHSAISGMPLRKAAVRLISMARFPREPTSFRMPTLTSVDFLFD